jgi:hypothetical protein
LSREEKVRDLIGDVALPLMGYFLWNWNLYFILLYFMLDQLSRTCFLPWRLKLTNLNLLKNRKLIVRSFLLLFSEILLIHIFIKSLLPTIEFQKEISNFIHYSDMGIEQGYILLPLLILGEWLRLKQDLRMGFVGKRQIEILRRNKNLSFFRISFFAFFIGLILWVPLNEKIMAICFFVFISLLVLIPIKINLTNIKT